MENVKNGFFCFDNPQKAEKYLKKITEYLSTLKDVNKNSTLSQQVKILNERFDFEWVYDNEGVALKLHFPAFSGKHYEVLEELRKTGCVKSVFGEDMPKMLECDKMSAVMTFVCGNKKVERSFAPTEVFYYPEPVKFLGLRKKLGMKIPQVQKQTIEPFLMTEESMKGKTYQELFKTIILAKKEEEQTL